MKKLDPVNIKYLEGYVRSLTLKQLRTTSINDKLRRIYVFLIYSEFRDLMTATPIDIEDFLISRKTKPTKRG
ncbi:MAG: integrase, partial [Methanomicrobiales archaeon]